MKTALFVVLAFPIACAKIPDVVDFGYWELHMLSTLLRWAVAQ
jgi:hypothetical protein